MFWSRKKYQPLTLEEAEAALGSTWPDDADVLKFMDMANDMIRWHEYDRHEGIRRLQGIGERRRHWAVVKTEWDSFLADGGYEMRVRGADASD